jgi:hypothetical protein
LYAPSADPLYAETTILLHLCKMGDIRDVKTFDTFTHIYIIKYPELLLFLISGNDATILVEIFEEMD